MTARIVLLYHRVAAIDCDPWRLAVTPSHFAEHLDLLSRTCRCVALAELLEGRLDGDPRPRVAVTFDDGYVDVLTTARPLLDQFDVPATMFLPTGLLGSKDRFWWDELARIVLQSPSLPAGLELDLGATGRMFEWRSGIGSEPSIETAVSHSWRAWDEPLCDQHRLFRRLWEELLPLEHESQQRGLAALRRWAGVAGDDGGLDRCLGAAEVARLQAGGLVDLGAHTVHHQQLSALSRAAQQREIEEGLAAVRDLSSAPVRAFAFPYGKPGDYTAETLELVGRAGFAWALTNVEGTIDGRARLELPRCFVEDGDGDSLGRSLARWAGERRSRPATVSVGGAATADDLVTPRLSGPAVGSVRFGDLRRLRPVSRTFGFDRGTPVDRWYIERFLDRHRLAIRGRVLEIGDDRYTREFGGDRVERSDVLHVEAGHPGVTLVADLAAADHLPADTWDAIVCTQTLHLVYDVEAALATLHRILKPGGTLLVTVPGISPIADDRWRESWYWSFTAISWRRLVEAAFSGGSIEVRTHGNVLAATAFLQGLAAQEVEERELDAYDPRYPLVVVASAVKRDPRAMAPRRDTATLVSVVIPCHDQADTLEEAIASVESQTYPRWELIVVDDGSTDDSARVASAHSAVKLVRQENRGLAAARNAGMAAAAGDFVVFLDADDRLLPGALDTGGSALAEHPECALVCGHHRTIAGDGSPQVQWPAFHPAGGHYYGLLQGNFIAAIHSAMFRREALAAVGGFDPSLRAAEDYDLYLRLARRFPMHCHGVEVAEYRRRSSSMTGDPGLLLDSTLEALRRQRSHLRRDPVLLDAYRAGMQWWRDFYGSRLAEELRRPETTASRRLRDLWLLARHHPRALASLALGRPAAASGSARRVARPEPATFDGPAEVLEWLSGEIEHRDEVLQQRDQAIAWLQEKLDEARATIEARDAAVAWLQSRLESAAGHQGPTETEKPGESS